MFNAKRLKQKREILKRQWAVIVIALCIAGLVVNCSAMSLMQELDKVDKNLVIVPVVKTLEEKIEEVVSEELSGMELAIRNASIEFNVPEWLIIGIANAESGLGKHFAVDYDRDNCHNWWGLKGGNMARRADGSYLRCFIDEESGARTVAKALRNYYLDEGRDTPEKICQKWIGGKFANKPAGNGKTHCENWVSNVNKFKI